MESRFFTTELLQWLVFLLFIDSNCLMVFLSSKFVDYLVLLRLHKPIGIFLLLWPTFWGLWLASSGIPEFKTLCIFVLGVVLMRSAGCAINDYADRDIDVHVERTKDRPVAVGRVSAREALVLASVLAILAFLITIPLGLKVLLMAIPAVFLAATYPFTKRFFAFPQAYLGVAFGFSIPMAFVAVQGQVPPVAWLVFLANVFWTVAYDTEYALVDKQDDLKLNIRTAAITLGRWDVLAIMICYTCCLAVWAGVALMLFFKPVFWVFWLLAVGIVVYHYGLIRERERSQCFKAFLHNNWLGATLFLGVFFNYAMLY